MVVLFALLTINSSANAQILADLLAAGWRGTAVFERLHEDPNRRILRCTFPPGVGHEKHYHRLHFGYALAGGKMRMTDQRGSREMTLTTSCSYVSEGVAWHEVINIVTTPVVYLIVESKAD